MENTAYLSQEPKHLIICTPGLCYFIPIFILGFMLIFDPVVVDY